MWGGGFSLFDLVCIFLRTKIPCLFSLQKRNRIKFYRSGYIQEILIILIFLKFSGIHPEKVCIKCQQVFLANKILCLCLQNTSFLSYCVLFTVNVLGTISRPSLRPSFFGNLYRLTFTCAYMNT